MDWILDPKQEVKIGPAVHSTYRIQIAETLLHSNMHNTVLLKLDITKVNTEFWASLLETKTEDLPM